MSSVKPGYSEGRHAKRHSGVGDEQYGMTERGRRDAKKE